MDSHDYLSPEGKSLIKEDSIPSDGHPVNWSGNCMKFICLLIILSNLKEVLNHQLPENWWYACIIKKLVLIINDLAN